MSGSSSIARGVLKMQYVERSLLFVSDNVRWLHRQISVSLVPIQYNERSCTKDQIKRREKKHQVKNHSNTQSIATHMCIQWTILFSVHIWTQIAINLLARYLYWAPFSTLVKKHSFTWSKLKLLLFFLNRFTRKPLESLQINK